MDIQQLKNIISSESVGFSAKKIKNPKLLWLNQDKIDTGAENEIISNPEVFLNNFSYLIADTECFKDIAFDESTARLTAERYGGLGVGVNGGGSRAGNLGGYQLKGIGANCLVGESIDLAHSYGGLDALNAIVEVIYTNVLKEILPLGVVNIYGLIFTGEDTAYDSLTKAKCWGVIMVREECIRPAHFLPSTGYKPLVKHRREQRSDTARTRNVNKELAQSFESHNKFIIFLGKFLASCANQFAFARVARIMNATLSSSNISIDGRWLDLPISSFLSGGRNFGLSSVFYSEPLLILNYALEMLHTYSKYNNATLNPVPIINYYSEQFNAYCQLHMGFVLALPAQILMTLKKSEWNKVSDIFLKVINSGKIVLRSRPIADPKDPVIALLMGVFLSLVDKTSANNYFMMSGLAINDITTVNTAFKQLIECSYESEKAKYSNLESYAICTTIQALKRSILAEFYYLSSVEHQTRELCEQKTPEDVAPFINRYGDAAKWIFERDIDSEVTLFKSKTISVTYLIGENCYVFFKPGECDTPPMKFNNYINLFIFIESLDENYFVINQFGFKDFFARLNLIIPQLSLLTLKENTGTEYV